MHIKLCEKVYETYIKFTKPTFKNKLNTQIEMAWY
jgi:hypothetical protein